MKTNVIPINCKQLIRESCAFAINNIANWNNFCDDELQIDMITIFEQYDNIEEDGCVILEIDKMNLRNIRRLSEKVWPIWIRLKGEIESGKHGHFILDKDNKIIYNEECDYIEFELEE